MFSRLLVANRGEIACRIFRTCRRLGITTIAVYSEADRAAQHVRMADLAVPIGPGPAAESYLRIDRILEAAKRTGAEAIHPGYGFLSERPSFARAVRDAGLTFIGPSPEAMERLGNKDTAKRLAAAAGVPVVPGYDGEAQSLEVLAREARRIGVPLLIKAAAGGGGKGMRRVVDLRDFEEALAACQREAEAAFGDNRVLLERWLEAPRHVEVQVFGDGRGGAVHLFERDCSLQRRHQKIIEEAPAPGLDEATRLALGRAATALVRHVGYANAGTVEFLVDGDGRFFFIEMNTRLQVEHPVTEAVTGLDLVEWQILIAAGAGLPKAQEDIHYQGHAIEARLYAEDPARGFLPQAGRIERLVLAHGVEGVRIDSGVEEGDCVPPFYDPMIAKLIVHAQDRSAARAKLQHALDRSAVLGLTTNLDFLRSVVRDQAFRSASIDTGWLDRGDGAHLLAPRSPSEALTARAAVVSVAFRLHQPLRRDPTHPRSPWDVADGFRLSLPPIHLIRLDAGNGERDLRVIGEGDGFCVESEAGRYHLRVLQVAPPLITLEEQGVARTLLAVSGPSELIVVDDGEAACFQLLGQLAHAGEDQESGAVVVAPLPGRVVRVLVEAGSAVERGQTLVLIEAMKMEQKIVAPRDGRIAEVRVTPGERVEEGRVLLVYAGAEVTH